jgi:hypothetical protein
MKRDQKPPPLQNSPCIHSRIPSRRKYAFKTSLLSEIHLHSHPQYQQQSLQWLYKVTSRNSVSQTIAKSYISTDSHNASSRTPRAPSPLAHTDLDGAEEDDMAFDTRPRSLYSSGQNPMFSDLSKLVVRHYILCFDLKLTRAERNLTETYPPLQPHLRSRSPFKLKSSLSK